MGWPMDTTSLDFREVLHGKRGMLLMKREDFISDLAWERYVEERAYYRKLYQKQGFWCLAIVILFIIVAAIK